MKLLSYVQIGFKNNLTMFNKTEIFRSSNSTPEKYTLRKYLHMCTKKCLKLFITESLTTIICKQPIHLSVGKIAKPIAYASYAEVIKNETVLYVLT